ncbi:AAA family ATPase [Streptomyces sp. LX-29]|uniref:ATP-binding protein n=1 Tax=Streptomyces sp. LX-29 TaxID=2900152 RepID=UPI00240E49A1|nr:AAA family ATPase [Streptomyces sp. LX-29]WFB11456.1 AAA family ATPase [Streptomyces sp. LX-29]
MGNRIRPGRRLVEREAEIDAMERALTGLCGAPDDASGRRAGGVIAFAGPAGVGKTALLAEVRRSAVARGCTVLTARGGEHEQGLAFHVVRQLVQPVLAAATEEQHRAILGSWYDIVAPAVGLVVPKDGGAPDPQGVRDGLDWLVTRFAVQRAPVVMILDDAHWADTESLDWLTGFAPRAEDLPMLLVVGYRPEDLSADAAAFRRLAERQGSRPHLLAPLTPGAVGRIVRDAIGDEADEAFCRECWAVTGGNPFEVVELAAKVYDRELKPGSSSAAELRQMVSMAKDSGLIERLERLGTSAVRLAWAVAVLGAEATPTLATAVAAISSGDTPDLVARLRDARILAPAPTGAGKPFEERLEFFHPLVATAVYRAIPGSLRVAMHGQAATAAIGAGLGAAAAGRHVLEMHPEADPWVVQQLREAAREYLRAGAPDAARRCLARALREPPAMEERAAVLFELGCSALLTEPAITVNYLKAALEEPVLDSALRDAITVRLAQAYGHSGHMEEAARIVAAEARAATSARTRLRMQAEQFMWNAFRADEADSPARSRRLARLVEHLSGRGLAERYLLGLRAWDAVVRGESADSALRYAEAALGDGLDWTDDNWGFEVPVLVALTFMYCDQPGRAEELFHQGIAECERKGWRGSHLSFGLTLLGYVRYRRGRLGEAEELVREGLRISARVGASTPAEWAAVGTLVLTLIGQGRTEDAQRVAVEYDYGQSVPKAVVYPDAQAAHGELLLATGLHREARQQLAAAGRRLDARGWRNPAFCPWQPQLARALALTDPAAAVETAADAVRRARQFGTPSATGQALHAAASVATGSERMTLLAEAVSHLERSPAAYDLAHALVDHGAALRRIGLPQEAGDRLHRGLRGALQCGADTLAARARDELSAIGLRSLRLRVDATGALTRQEQAVAERAAAGWTDARIADELGLAEREVARLLSAVFRKVGTDRPGLARAIGTGLQPPDGAPGGR